MLADRIIQLNRSHRRALMIALVVVAAVGLYRWILAPYSGQLWAAQRYNSTLNSAIHKADTLGTTLEVKKARIETLTRESNRLRNQSFTPGEVHDFFASLQTIAQQANCVIQSVSSAPEQRGGSPNQPKDGSGIIGKKAVVTIIGGYGDIVRFLKELQASERKVWVESVKLGTGDNVGKLKCQVVLTLYCIDSLEMTLYE
jgi:Tfp pilus assembly protein PilO